MQRFVMALCFTFSFWGSLFLYAAGGDAPEDWNMNHPFRGAAAAQDPIDMDIDSEPPVHKIFQIYEGLPAALRNALTPVLKELGCMGYPSVRNNNGVLESYEMVHLLSLIEAAENGSLRDTIARQQDPQVQAVLPYLQDL